MRDRRKLGQLRLRQMAVPVVVFLVLSSSRLFATQPPPDSQSGVIAQARRALEQNEAASARKLLETAMRQASQPASVRAEAAYLLSTLAMRAGDPEEAVGYLQQAVHLQPGSFAAHYELGLALCAIHHCERAQHELEQAVALRPAQPEALYNLGVVLLDNGHALLALSRLQQVKAAAGDSADLSYQLTRAALQAGKKEEALHELQQAEPLFSNDWRWRTAMGGLLYQAHLARPAVEQLEAAWRLQPGNLDLRHQLGYAQLAAGDPSAVISLITTPADEEDLYLLASACLVLKRVDEAASLASQALARAPRKPEYLLLKARVDQQQNHSQAALDELQKAEPQLNSQLLPEILYREAVSHYFLGQYAEARQSLQRASAMTPLSTRALFLYAITLENEGKSEQELHYLRLALAHDPSNPRLLCHLGLVMMATSRLSQAHQAFLAAIRSNPAFAFAHFQLARVLLQEHENAAAAEELEQTVRLAPDYPPALYQLSHTYQAMGKKQQAADTMKRFLDLRQNEVAQERAMALGDDEQLQAP